MLLKFLKKSKEWDCVKNYEIFIVFQWVLISHKEIYHPKYLNLFIFAAKSKVKKVAVKGAKVLGGTVAVLGGIGAISGFDRPVVEQVRQRGSFERAIRGR